MVRVNLHWIIHFGNLYLIQIQTIFQQETQGHIFQRKSDNTNVCEKHFINYTIQKASSSIATLPAANSGLIYSGVAQPLVTAGNADGGTIQYKLDGGEWTNKVPTAVKAGTYKVFYRIQGDKKPYG